MDYANKESKPSTCRDTLEIPVDEESPTVVRAKQLSRTARFGQIDGILLSPLIITHIATVYLSLMIGSYLGGSLTRLGTEKGDNYTAPFVVSFILTVLELGWLVFVLPESLASIPSLEEEEDEPVRKESLISSVFKKVTGLFQSSVSVFLSRNTSHTFLILIILSVTLALGQIPYLYLYTAYKWQWTAFDIGNFIVVLAVSRWYIQLTYSYTLYI